MIAKDENLYNKLYCYLLNFQPINKINRMYEDQSNDEETTINILELAIYYQNDKDTVLGIIKKSPEQICDVSPCMKGYDEIIKTALSLNGMLLKDLKMQSHIYEYCMIAVKQNGMSIKYCYEKLKDYKILAKEAVKNNCNSYQFIAKELKNNEEIALIAIKKNINLVDFIGIELKRDVDFISLIIEIEGFNLSHISITLIENTDICRKAILNNVNNYAHACDSVREEEKIIDYVLERNIKMFKYVPLNIRNETEFILKWIKKSKGYNIMRNVNYKIFRALKNVEEVHKYYVVDFGDLNFIGKNDGIKLMTSNPFSYHNLSKNLKKDPDIVNILVSKCNNPQYIANRLCDDVILSMYQLCKIIRNCDNFSFLNNVCFGRHIYNNSFYNKEIMNDIQSKAFLKRFEYYLGNELNFPNIYFDLDIFYDNNKIKNYFTHGNDNKKQKFI